MQAPATSEATIIELPAPPAQLNPNVARRLHWAERAEAAAQYRADCTVLALAVRNAARGRYPLPAPVEAHITFVRRTRRRVDVDNLLASIKPGIDALVQAGLIADDSAWVLRILPSVEVGPVPMVRIKLRGGVQ